MKLGMAVVVASTIGVAATPVVADAKSKPVRFTNTDLKRYYKNASSKTAFYLKSSKKQGTMLIFGDFGKNPNVKYGRPTSIKSSKNAKTLTVKYKLIQFKTTNGKSKASLTKKNYTLKLTKKSKSKFTAKVAGKVDNYGRHMDNSGKTYTYTQVKKSPAKAYTNKYTKPVLYKSYLKAFASSTDAKTMATKYTNQAVKNMINNFNYKF